MKNKIGLIILIVGIGITIYGYFGYTKYQDEHNRYVSTLATIDQVEINNNTRLYKLRIEVNNNTYESNIRLDEDYEIGNTVKVYYDKNYPNNTKLKLSTIYKPLGILITGVIVFLLGFILCIRKVLNNSRIKNLKKNGILINAMIQEVLVVPKDKGKNPYKIRAQYLNPQDNKTYFFESEEVETDLKDIVSKKNIRSIPVYLNKKKTSDYYVDIDSIR